NQSNGTLLTATVTLSTAVTGPAVNLSFFNYFDFDVAGTSAGDSATLMSDNPALRMRIVDTNGSIAEARALDASAYQVGSFSNVRNLLTNANADNLNNTGLPFGPGDFTGAVQWDVLLNPGNTITLQSSFLLNPVPEPATMTALALGAVALLRRRRK